MKLEPRISVITIGVDVLDRAPKFYDALGLERYDKIDEGVAFYQMGGLILSLWPRIELAGDIGLAPSAVAQMDTRPSIVLAYNTRSPPDVADILNLAAEAGGRIIKEGNRAFWGGTQGYFADTEGNVWEVAYNPDFLITADGSIRLPQ